MTEFRCCVLCEILRCDFRWCVLCEILRRNFRCYVSRGTLWWDLGVMFHVKLLQRNFRCYVSRETCRIILKCADLQRVF